MTRRSRTSLLALGALGLGASSLSSYVHYKLLTETNYSSFCDVNAAVSCTQAYLSRYGSVWGVPVALAGVFFFVLVLLLAAVAGKESSPARDSAPGYIFVLSTIGLAFVLYLGWASYVQLKAFCILCAITYAAVIGIFIVSGGATTVPMTALPRRAPRDLRSLASSPVALVFLLMFVAGAGSVIAFFPREGVAAQAPPVTPLTDQQRSELTAWWDVQPKVELPIPNAGEKVQVVVFSDFMCPTCRAAHEIYRGVVASRSGDGRVRFLLKHFPLEVECNPAAPGNHTSSCEAAAAVVQATPLGNAEKMTAWFFANQPSLSPSVVREAAGEVGGIADFNAGYAESLKEVAADAAMGAKLGVNSTPTIFLNGRKLGRSLLPAQYLDALIELELQRVK